MESDDDDTAGPQVLGVLFVLAGVGSQATFVVSAAGCYVLGFNAQQCHAESTQWFWPLMFGIPTLISLLCLRWHLKNRAAQNLPGTSFWATTSGLGGLATLACIGFALHRLTL